MTLPTYRRDVLKPVFSIIKKPHEQEIFMELRIQTMTLQISGRDVLKPVFFDNKKASRTRGLNGVKDSNHDSPDFNRDALNQFFDNKKASRL